MAIGWAITAAVAVLLAMVIVAGLMKTARASNEEYEAAHAPVYIDAEVEAVNPALLEDTLHLQEYFPVFTATVTDEEITLAAQTVWGEARGIESQMEQAAVVWCMLNRVDAWGDSLGKVVTAPNQFAYSAGNPTVDDFGRDLEELVRDVVSRWEREKAGECGVGRVLPHNYLWFGAWDGRNWFRSSYDNLDHPWSWRLPNPYDS